VEVCDGRAVDGDIIHAEGVRVWFYIIRAGGAQGWAVAATRLGKVWSSLTG
jgi:hypothetical protein